MTCTEEYKEHIEYTFHAFCKIVIRNASYTALRTWSRKHKREISLDYITDEKHYPAISLPLGGNTRTMQPLSADGWLTIPLKLPRKGAYPITATRREKVYETSF